jgi:hypothetical protein
MQATVNGASLSEQNSGSQTDLIAHLGENAVWEWLGYVQYAESGMAHREELYPGLVEELLPHQIFFFGVG